MRTQTGSILSHGIIAGSFGYLIVAAAHAGVNVIQGRAAFATAAHLGASFVHRTAAAGGVVDPAAVIAFNGIHLATALLAGIVASWLIHEWEAHPDAGYFVFFVLIAGLIMGSFMSAVVISELAQAASWPAVLVSNSLAAVVMGAYLLTAHPTVRRQLGHMGGD